MRQILTITLILGTLIFTGCGGGGNGSGGGNGGTPANKAPHADAGSNQSIKQYRTITLVGQGTDSDGTIERYEWKKGTVVLSTNATFDYTPTVAGTDTLTLTVTDDDNATDTDSLFINVIADQKPVITAKSVLTSTEGNTTDYEIQVTDAEDEDSTLEVKWRDNANNILSSDRTLSISGLPVGLHQITISATDSVNNTSTHNLSLAIFKDQSINVTTVKTGQVLVYETNDDGDLENGLDRNYVRDARVNMLFDFNRGLIWEDTYTNNDILAGYTYTEALNRCQLLSLGGLTWRLPTIYELMTPIDRVKDSIDSYETTFEHTINTAQWNDYSYRSSTTVESNTSQAYTLSTFGTAYSFSKEDHYITRCVSGENSQNMVDGDFLSNGVDVVGNTKISLEFQDDANTSDNNKSWTAAVGYCNGLTLNGSSDWRLPNEQELLATINITDSTPKIFPVFTQVHNSAAYWTSTTVGRIGTSLGGTYTNNAVILYPKTGRISATGKTNGAQVRCVRDL